MKELSKARCMTLELVLDTEDKIMSNREAVCRVIESAIKEDSRILVYNWSCFSWNNPFNFGRGYNDNKTV